MMDFAKGIVSSGNWYRLRSAMDRAAAGKRIAVGFIGGSITQGSLSSTPQTCYAYLVYKWWEERFPDTRYINAGIGGTTSQFGVARVEEDLLRYGPDVVFIEFSVNDSDTALFRETYEGLVRKVWKTGAAVVLIHNVRYDTGDSAEDIHLQIGRHYHLPCVSMKSTIYPQVAFGEIPNREITPDDLHPNDAGHALVAEVVRSLLDQVYASEEPHREEPILPAPLTANQYEESLRYQNHNSRPQLDGFTADDTPQEHITQMFRRGFTAWKKGDRITFSVEGTGIAVQYRKSVKKPAPIARVTVDEKTAVLLDANFQEDWGDCLYVDTVLVHGEDKRHKVEIEITEAHPDDQVPFYLVSVIGSR